MTRARVAAATLIGAALGVHETHDVTVKMLRRPGGTYGRFGGGWEWNVGVQAGKLAHERGTVIVNLLVFAVRIDWRRR